MSPLLAGLAALAVGACMFLAWYVALQPPSAGRLPTRTSASMGPPPVGLLHRACAAAVRAALGDTLDVVRMQLEGALPVRASAWMAAEGVRSLALRLPGRLFVLTADPEVSRQLHAQRDVFHEPTLLRDAFRAFASGIITREGADWVSRRHALNPMFAPAHLRRIARGAHTAVTRWLDAMHDPAGGAPACGATLVDASAVLPAVVFDVMAAAMLSWDARATDEATHAAATTTNPASHSAPAATSGAAAIPGVPSVPASVIMQSLNDVLEVLNVLQLMPRPLWRWTLPRERQRRFAAGTAHVRKLAEDVVAARIAAEHPTAEHPDDENEDMDLLDALFRSGGLAPADIVEEVMTLMIGGTETSAHTLTWLLYALVRHTLAPTPPGAAYNDLFELHGEVPTLRHAANAHIADNPILARVREEVLGVTGGVELAWKHLDALRFTEAVLKETLRMYNTAPGTAREAVVPADIAGQKVPAGTIVSAFATAMHFNARSFPRPGEFIPERWLDTADASVRPTALASTIFIAFGAGVRNCIGSKFALVQMKTALALLALRVRAVTLAPDCAPVMPRAALTVRPRSPMRVLLHWR